jgi:hypothetical protein
MRLHDKLDQLRNDELMGLIARQNETLELLREQIKSLGGGDTVT